MEETAREFEISKIVQVIFYAMMSPYVEELSVLPKVVGDVLEEVGEPSMVLL